MPPLKNALIQWKIQGNFLENQSTQGRLRENFYSYFQFDDI